MGQSLNSYFYFQETAVVEAVAAEHPALGGRMAET